MSPGPRFAGSVALLLAISAGAALAQEDHGEHPAGTIDFPVSCTGPAQLEFTRAAILLHHMTYPEARAGFERAATADPECAMAHWGVAMTLFQPLWPTRPGPEQLRRGWTAVERARAVGTPTERESRLIDAAAAFFLEPDSTDYWLRIRRWEAAMSAAHAALPDDSEITAFYALARLATAPADSTAAAHADSTTELLLQVYQRNPAHPGAMHYIVHASDAPGRERALLEVTQSYEAVAPLNPHALHMPTHIHTRLGDWDAVVAGNLKAADAALDFPAGDGGQLVWDEFPHAIEYLVYGYLQQGQDDLAAEQLRRLVSTERLEPTFKTAFHLASTNARFVLERRDWAGAAALVPREPASLAWDRFPWPEAVTWYARGLGAAHLGRLADARAAAARIDTLAAAAGRVGETLFARNIRILGLTVHAWLAHAERRDDDAVMLMRQAAELERTTPKHAVTPAPTLPAEELLGDLLMELGRPAEALAAYERSLALYPGRFNSRLGAARAGRRD